MKGDIHKVIIQTDHYVMTTVIKKRGHMQTLGRISLQKRSRQKMEDDACDIFIKRLPILTQRTSNIYGVVLMNDDNATDGDDGDICRTMVTYQ